MTVPIVAPGVPGAEDARRRRRLLISGGVVSALLILGLGLWQIGVASGSDNLTCDNAAETWLKTQAEIEEVLANQDLSDNQKSEQLAELRKERDAAKLKVGSDGCKEDSTTTTTPSGDACGGVKYRSYDVKGVIPGAVVRFGNQPVEVSGPGDANKVLDVLDKQISTEAFKAAGLTQGNYLIDGGITADQVQATATRFQQNPEQWRDSNRAVRQKLGRAESVTLEQTNRSYNTQDAVLGENRCVAPAAQNTTSNGQKWVLVIRLSQQDGGRTVRLVVDCDFQIQEFGEAPTPAPPAATPTPAPPRGTTPTPTPTTAPPVVTTAPPVTQPPTTAPPTTAPPTVPPKLCGVPGKPLCTGVVTE